MADHRVVRQHQHILGIPEIPVISEHGVERRFGKLDGVRRGPRAHGYASVKASTESRQMQEVRGSQKTHMSQKTTFPIEQELDGSGRFPLGVNLRERQSTKGFPVRWVQHLWGDGGGRAREVALGMQRP